MGFLNEGDRPSKDDCQDDERAFPCDHTSPYRTITGWCNNLQSPKLGQSFTAHERLLASAYEDGLGRPRQFSRLLASQETGERLALPSPRLVSTSMHEDPGSRPHSRYSPHAVRPVRRRPRPHPHALRRGPKRLPARLSRLQFASFAVD